jgi:hypothetical protein
MIRVKVTKLNNVDKVLHISRSRPTILVLHFFIRLFLKLQFCLCFTKILLLVFLFISAITELLIK